MRKDAPGIEKGDEIAVVALKRQRPYAVGAKSTGNALTYEETIDLVRARDCDSRPDGLQKRHYRKDGVPTGQQGARPDGLAPRRSGLLEMRLFSLRARVGRRFNLPHVWAQPSRSYPARGFPSDALSDRPLARAQSWRYLSLSV